MASESGTREDADLFRRLVEHSLGLMCVHDLDGNLLFVNTAAAQSLGFRVEDGVGWNLRRFLAPSVESEFDGYLARIRDTGADSGLMRVVAKDGKERIWLYRNVLYEEPGKPARVLGHAQDITERIRAEGALRESEQRFRLLADTAPVLIWMSDPGGRCIFLNHRWLEFTGRALEEQLDGGWADSVHPADRDRVVEAHQAAVAARTEFRAEYRLRRADGEYRWVLGRGMSRIEGDGAFAGLVGSCVDVSDIRQAREVLEEARDRLAALVAQRTAELERSNAKLRAEIRHRVRIEEEIARVRRLADERTRGGPASGKSKGRQGVATVLLVENQEDVRHLMRSVLQLHGYRVVDVADSGGALALVAQDQEPVDLLIVDIATPGTGGPALADRLAAAHPGLRTLYMSGAGAAGEPAAVEADAVLLKKPFTMMTLVGKVREALDG
jgi:PAS domain S-box-containing protein